MPQNYERVDNMSEREAWDTWLNTYKKGMLTSEDMEGLDAYKKIKDFKGKERTKESIADIFGFEYNAEQEEEPRERMQLPLVRGQDGRQYIVDPNRNLIPLEDIQRNHPQIIAPESENELDAA
jgi:hypothetical protein